MCWETIKTEKLTEEETKYYMKFMEDLGSIEDYRKENGYS